MSSVRSSVGDRGRSKLLKERHCWKGVWQEAAGGLRGLEQALEDEASWLS